MTKFFVDPRAKQDIFDAASWYAKQSESTDEAFAEAIDDAFAEIAVAPTRWPILEVDFRYRLVNRFPYLVVYRIRGDSIVVVAVAHTSRAVYWTDR